MAYDVGLSGLAKFTFLIRYVENDDWQKAAGACKRQGIPR